MGLFSRKKKEDEVVDEESSEEEFEESKKEEPEETPKDYNEKGDISLPKIVADLEKLKAQFNTFYELNKVATERFTRINEQIGELRTMILERERDSKMLEAKATQAIDMVETVQPDKLMIELRKEDAKVEALRANIESNEVIVNNVISELKEIRTKMQIFAGMEQVVKLNEEVKKDLMEIKKMSATIERHSDKVETIFSEMQKRYSNFERFSDKVEDADKSIKQLTSELDNIKTKVTDFSSKRELEGLIIKFNSFEKHVSGIMSLINRKFENLEREFTDKFNERIEKMEKLLKGFEELAKKTPDLDKYFNLLEEEAKKIPQKEVKVEKIKVPGQEEPTEKVEKTSLFGKLKEKIPKIGGK